MGNLVELNNIHKKYGNKKVLHNISLCMEENQIIAIMGGNGTGKSTLLQIIAGINRPNSGSVIYSSKSIKIGYVPERFPKEIRFTPSEYLHYMGRMSGVPKDVLHEKIEELMDKFQLEQFNYNRITELSKGNIQKVGIIQALLHNPELIILDEPLSGLDLKAQETLKEIILELKGQGRTILFTYHESNELEAIVDSTYFLKDGAISSMETSKVEPIKLLIVKSIQDMQLKHWEGVLHVEKNEGSVYLYISLNHSDEILYKILELNGSVEAVSTISGNNLGRKQI